MDAKLREMSADQTILTEPLNSLLAKLAEDQGYLGEADDLDDLKQRSLELKREPAKHRDSIAVLDSAIASHMDEMRTAISTAQLASKVVPGTNIYSDFVNQKLTFLSSERARFYDHGPFEIPRRLLLANALESQYFLKSGTEARALLYDEIKLLEEALERIKNPEYSYLPIVTRRPRKLQENGTLFWKASLLFALGEKVALREILRNLVIDNRFFGLDTKSPGHVYIYKVLDLPSEIIVREGFEKDGKPRIETKDTLLLKRFYNPAQLALIVCGHLDSAGTDLGIAEFIKEVGDLTPHDYYVVAASGDDPVGLEQFAKMLMTIMGNDARDKRNQLLGIVVGQDGGVSEKIRLGAQRCGVEDDVRDEVYSPFGFLPEVRHIDGLGKYKDHLLFGGRLRATQANTVADFLNGTVLNDPDIKQKMLEGDTRPAYIARMPIDRLDAVSEREESH